tara:strand:- start:252 stop:620 length:369 start_codon:yes stop_codon:yes gene_type:complete
MPSTGIEHAGKDLLVIGEIANGGRFATGQSMPWQIVADDVEPAAEQIGKEPGVQARVVKVTVQYKYSAAMAGLQVFVHGYTEPTARQNPKPVLNTGEPVLQVQAVELAVCLKVWVGDRLGYR